MSWQIATILPTVEWFVTKLMEKIQHINSKAFYAINQNQPF